AVLQSVLCRRTEAESTPTDSRRHRMAKARAEVENRLTTTLAELDRDAAFPVRCPDFTTVPETQQVDVLVEALFMNPFEPFEIEIEPHWRSQAFHFTAVGMGLDP